jgi:hypothetical protein
MSELTTKLDSLIQTRLQAYHAAIKARQMAQQYLKIAQAEASAAGYSYYLSMAQHEFGDRADADLKRGFWRSMIDATRLSAMMDSETRDKMEADIEKRPPEPTKENAENILLDLFNRRDTIIADSLLNVFRGLSAEYRSNDKAKLTDKRLVIYMGSRWGHSSKLTDLDRFFHFIDGKDFNAQNRGETLGYRVEYAKEDVIETEYFKIRKFKNGNAHLYFLRKDMIDQCNRLIAYHNKNRLA